MSWTPINTLSHHIGETAGIRGWITHVRSSGRVQFLVVRDGTGVVQCVTRGGNGDPGALTQETAVSVIGTVRADPRAPGGVELETEDVTIIGTSHEYPITPKAHGVDFLMEHRHLWVRSPRQAAILRIRSAVVAAARGFLDRNGFVAADPPIISPSAAEGTSSLFSIDYFGEPAYLSQSGQLYLEALAMALGRVYAFGPTFRAEKSKTRRHLTEFWMLEPEMAFVEFEENLEWQERLVSEVVAAVVSRCGNELAILDRDTAGLKRVAPPFPRISYDEVVERLNHSGLTLEWGEDLGAPHETAVASWFDRPVFVTRFPTKVKAFYMQPDPNRPEVVLAADLLAPDGYGEIVGGSQRIHDLALLESRLAEHGLNPADYAWYVDLRRYGSVPHSGFGLGLERVVAWLAGLEHVRETTAFARTLNRVWP